MSGIYSHHDYANDPLRAIEAVGRLLAMGSLRLFLGAGVSAGFGLPEWKLLVARVLGRDGDPAFVAGLSSTGLGRLLDPVDDGSEAYYKRVHEALYRGVATDLL